MKRHLLLLSLFSIVMSLDAQITITTADVAVPNKLIYQSNDTMPTVSAGSAGTSQTWNMAILNSHTTDTLNFISPSWTPYASSFPAANLSVKNGYAAQYGMAQNTSSSLVVLGNAANVDLGNGPTDLKQYNTPAEILLNFPSTYMSSFTNNYVSDLTFYFGMDPGIGFTVDSVRQKSVVNKTSNCDAWGNITTPLGTFASLRFQVINHHTDSTFIYVGGFGWNFFQEVIDSTKKYSWWANSVGFPLVETDIDWASGNVSHVNWLQALPVTGISENAMDQDGSVYPNPAQNELNFRLDAGQVGLIEIYDITGRLVVSASAAEEHVKINTAAFSKGLYTYTLLSRENVPVKKGKFTIAR
jgi:hypothetical protein